MYLIFSVIFRQHLTIFSQRLVTYLVPGVKGLPGGVDLVCHAGSDPRGYYYGMQNRDLLDCCNKQVQLEVYSPQPPDFCISGPPGRPVGGLVEWIPPGQKHLNFVWVVQGMALINRSNHNELSSALHWIIPLTVSTVGLAYCL
jgi:hypothetical protein